jgi:hypothetical protein
MNSYSDSTDRSAIDFFLFALGFIGFVVASAGMIVASPGTAIAGAVVLLLCVMGFGGRGATWE